MGQEAEVLGQPLTLPYYVTKANCLGFPICAIGAHLGDV